MRIISPACFRSGGRTGRMFCITLRRPVARDISHGFVPLSTSLEVYLMKKYLSRLLIFALVMGVAGAIQPVDAQVLGRLKKRAKERIEENLGRKQDKAIDEAMSGEEESGESTDMPPAEKAQSAKAAASLKPGEGAWANYDFVPGERPVYVDDFSGDKVGDFPRRMEFRSGNMDIVEWQGKRWLRADGGELYINLPEELPKRFTMEFDLAGGGNGMTVAFEKEEYPGRFIQINATQAWARSGDVNGEGSLGVDTKETPTRIRIMVDGTYVKLYADERRALNVPNADLGRSDRVYLNLNGWSADSPRLIADVRIMAGGRKLYDALEEEGRVVTQGIFFDTGSDKIRPESSPTLREIGDMLKEYSDLRLLIEGHTDDTGSADGNRTLSEARAGAVKAFMVSEYGIGDDRLETAGLGPDKPVGDNGTPEGRQMNRRVELVKL